VISATGPNRLYLMSGTINADQSHPGYHGTAPHVVNNQVVSEHPVTAPSNGA
jgi:phospholipase C